jgi:hypothetical protein
MRSPRGRGFTHSHPNVTLITTCHQCVTYLSPLSPVAATSRGSVWHSPRAGGPTLAEVVRSLRPGQRFVDTDFPADLRRLGGAGERVRASGCRGFGV